jgi:hypothetical protein
MFSWLGKGGSKLDHPMYSMAEAKKLLAELPEDDPFKALQEITSWLESITATAGFAAELRINLVKLLDETAQPIYADLLKQYLAAPHLQDFQGAHLWQGMHLHTGELAHAYEECLPAAKGAEMAAYQRHELLPLLTVRLMRATAERMKLELMRYQDVGNDIWERLFKHYSEAEAGQYAHGKLFAYPGYAVHTSPQHELLRALVFHESSTGNLAPDQMEVAFRVAARLVSFFDLTLAPDVTSEYCIDLAEPGPPVPVDDKTVPTPTKRFFTPLRALPHISDIIHQHERGTLEEERRFGSEFTPQGKLTVLKHLLVYWNKYHPRRAAARMGISANLQVAHGFRTIIGLVPRVDLDQSSGLSKEEAAALASRKGLSVVKEEGPAVKAETWTIVDASTGGVGGLIPRPAGAWVKVGCLLGLKVTNAQTWWVGVIRRLHSDPQNIMRAGIEILGKRSLAVWARVLGKGAERISDWQTSSGSFKFDYYPAILLPDAQNSYLHATMLLESGTYSEGKILELMLGDKSRNVELTTLEAEGEDYELVKFNWLAASPEKEKQA